MTDPNTKEIVQQFIKKYQAKHGEGTWPTADEIADEADCSIARANQHLRTQKAIQPREPFPLLPDHSEGNMTYYPPEETEQTDTGVDPTHWEVGSDGFWKYIGPGSE